MRGFAYGFGLPGIEGDLSSFTICRFAIEIGDDSITIVTKILAGFGQRPDRVKRRRPCQLSDLFVKFCDENKRPVIIAQQAHFLDEDTLYALKMVREFGEGFKTYPGAMILLGRVDRLRELIEAHPGVKMRILEMANPPLQLVDF